LHIEQGPRLERAGAQIGIVTGIVGARSFSLDFRGSSGHSGTTPMEGRRDAGLAAATFALAVNEAVVREYPDCVATIGEMSFHPGGFNVIPGSVRVSLEFRSLDPARLDELEAVLLGKARELGEVEITPVGHWTGTDLDVDARAAIATAAAGLDPHPTE